MNRTLSIDTDTAAQLGKSLHAMAQPLTILRGATGALQLSSGISVPDRRYVEMCSAQAERLCEMLAGLRDLLDAAAPELPAHCAQTDAKITSDCLKAIV